MFVLGQEQEHLLHNVMPGIRSGTVRIQTLLQKGSGALALWRARWGKITANSNLAIWGTTEDNDCYLCEDSMETFEHIFSHYSYTKEIWAQIQGEKPHLFPSNPSTLARYMEEARTKTVGTGCCGLSWMFLELLHGQYGVNVVSISTRTNHFHPQSLDIESLVTHTSVSDHQGTRRL